MMSRFYFVITSILLLGAIKINGDDVDLKTMPKGRLLTPEEGCGYSKVQNKRIIGGAPAKNGAWPWLALLGYRIIKKITFDCGGSLITSRHVLSAAHCMSHILYVVRLGEHDTRTTDDGPHKDVRVKNSIPHANYSGVLDINDIGIVYLARDVVFTDRIRPICLPIIDSFKTRSFENTNPFVAGWGITTERKGKMSTILMEVQVPVIENKICKELYQKNGSHRSDIQFSERVLCAGFAEGGKDSCQGDSGGPLMLPIYENGKFPFYQIGVVSNGDGCGQANKPGIYANIQYYAEWINEKLQE